MKKKKEYDEEIVVGECGICKKRKRLVFKVAHECLDDGWCEDCDNKGKLLCAGCADPTTIKKSETVFIDGFGRIFTDRPNNCGDPGRWERYCPSCYKELEDEEAESARSWNYQLEAWAWERAEDELKRKG